MYWEENTSDTPGSIPDNVIDVVYGIACRTLPVDHAFALATEITKEFDWLASEPGAGVHTIHVAASGNGWYRPESADQLLYPSRRTKLSLRIPKHRVSDAQKLVGKSLDIAGSSLVVKEMTEKKLIDIPTLFSRYIVADQKENETQFMEKIVAALSELGIKPRKMLCGKETQISMGDSVLMTRSLMIADLKSADSMLLQEKGLGSHRWMGCGLFLPHKDINEIGETMG